MQVQPEGVLVGCPMNAPTRAEATSGLVAEALQSWGTLRLRATGTSMLPTLWPGDLLTIESRTPAQLQPGELVLYIRPGRLFIHRVVSKSVQEGEPIVITRGDSMAENDPPVHSVELLGTVTLVERAGASRVPASRLRLPQFLLGRLLFHSDLLRRILLRLYAEKSDGFSSSNLIAGKAAS